MQIEIKPDEYTTLGHIDPLEFQSAIRDQFQVSVNLGDIKQVWECEMYSNRVTSFIRCSMHNYGAHI
jgi:hypothetical protein